MFYFFKIFRWLKSYNFDGEFDFLKIYIYFLILIISFLNDQILASVIIGLFFHNNFVLYFY